MVFVKNGQVVDRRQDWGLNRLLDVFWSVINAVGFFFQTLLFHDGVDKYKDFGRKKRWSGGGYGPSGGGPSGGGGPGGGPRITGMANYRGTSSCSTCCGGGCG
ncbi:probable selenoprotein K [Coccomyxa sp. Obi]|nr:probable selenoprotein K [Coccomyxa sp. Obi]